MSAIIASLGAAFIAAGISLRRHFGRIFALVYTLLKSSVIGMLVGGLLITAGIVGSVTVSLRILTSVHFYRLLTGQTLVMLCWMLWIFIVAVMGVVGGFVLEPLDRAVPCLLAFLCACGGIVTVMCGDVSSSLFSAATKWAKLRVTKCCIEKHGVTWTMIEGVVGLFEDISRSTIGKAVRKIVSDNGSELAEMITKPMTYQAQTCLGRGAHWIFLRTYGYGCLMPAKVAHKLIGVVKKAWGEDLHEKFSQLNEKRNASIGRVHDWLIKWADLEFMEFSGIGDVVVRETPVAGFRMKYPIWSRILGVIGALGCALLLNFEDAAISSKSGGCGRFLAKLLSRVINLILLILINIPIVLMLALWMFTIPIRLLVTATFMVGSTLGLIGKCIGFLLLIGLVFPFLVCLELFLIIGGLPLALILGLFAFIIGSPIVGTFFKAIGACFTCGCLNVEFQEWGIGTMIDYANGTFCCIWKFVYKDCVPSLGKTLISIPKELVKRALKSVGGVPDLYTDSAPRVWRATQDGIASPIMTGLTALIAMRLGCWRRMVDPGVDTQGGVYRVVPQNVNWSYMLSPDLTHIVRTEPRGPLLAQPVLIVSGPDGIVSLGTRVQPKVVVDKGAPIIATTNDVSGYDTFRTSNGTESEANNSVQNSARKSRAATPVFTSHPADVSSVPPIAAEAELTREAAVNNPDRSRSSSSRGASADGHEMADVTPMDEVGVTEAPPPPPPPSNEEMLSTQPRPSHDAESQPNALHDDDAP